MKVLKLIASLAAPFVAGGLGGIATSANITGWYAQLNKPPFNPPNWVFGPAWTLLYVLMGVSLYLVWTAESDNSKTRAFWAFGVQLVLNALWSLVFFGAHQPWLAAVVILALIAAIIWTMREFWQFSRWAVYLLVPYIAWVGFATVLNIAIAVLN